MKSSVSSVLGTAALLLSLQATAEVTFYEGEGFRGRAFTTDRTLPDFRRSGFNDRASSAVVDQGRWQVCDDTAFHGRCVILRQGSYDSLSRLGVDNRLSSVRKLSERGHYNIPAPEPMPVANYDYRRRSNERVYQAPVTSVHAVVGQAEQRCWMERGQVEQVRGDRNVAGGVIGAVIGGIVGHQIGNGRGNDVATVGGAVAGAVIGSNQGRGSTETRGNDIRRCENVANATPAYWDVGYRFREVDHQIQMTAPPGDSISVNRDGEPRQ